MSKYLFQRESSDNKCGPIAIANALIWAGFPLDKNKHLQYIYNMSKCTVGGTQRSSFEKALKCMASGFYSVEAVRAPTFNEFKHNIECGAAAVLLYHRGIYAHYCFITELIGNRFNTVNDILNKESTLRNTSTIKKYLKLKYVDGVYFPKVWFINKVI